MSNKNEVFEYLIDQLRQQVNNNQCEDLAHEVQSLKNQLRDASKQIKELHLALVKATGDVEAYKLIRKGDTPGCKHNWLRSKHRTGFFCPNCGARKEDTQVAEPWVKWEGGDITRYRVVKPECEHDWEYYYPNGRRCTKCGVINL